ncbi:MAG: hypothetical protein RLW87_07030 [Alphaproteobacteria bacterium]
MASHIFRDVFVSAGGEGSTLVATNTSPYFCLEAKSRDEALAKAARAFDFADQHRAEAVAPRRVEVLVPAWHRNETRALAAG